MSNNGWIKLHRQIRDNWIWSDAERLKAWLDLLLEVNHEDRQIQFEGHIKTIKRGQKLTSLRKLSERWGWSRNRVADFIRLLIEADMVTADRTRHGTLLTVVNYDFFQSQQDTHRATHEATHRATQRTHTEPHTEHKQELKNNKNDKKEREGQAPHSPFRPSEEFVRQYCSDHNLKINVDRFMAYYGARDWTLGKGMKVERPDQLEQLIKSWSSTEIYEKPESKELVNTMPAYQEFAHTPVELGEEPKFEGGVVAELLRRKRMKNA